MKNGDVNNRVSFFYGKVVESASFRMWNIYGHTIEGSLFINNFPKNV